MPKTKKTVSSRSPAKAKPAVSLLPVSVSKKGKKVAAKPISASSSFDIQDIAKALERVASAIERLAPPQAEAPALTAADAFVWHAATQVLQPVPRVSRVEIGLLRGIDRMRDILTDNTERFSRGLPANNALLWGARGMGKSSLVKAAHAEINANLSPRSPHLKLVEIHREDIDSLPHLMTLLRAAPFQFLLFCDDLSFDVADTSYKSLKAVLEGGIEGRPHNVLFYATSNRRHLMPRDMVDNERGTAINPGEAVEEKISLSDRFGLWLGFHNCSQAEYLDMIFAYVDHYGLTGNAEKITAEALEWSVTRGARSGRTAWQFIQDLAGRMGIALTT
jgi:predicted AAA+ superfamily ATPase